MKNLIIIVALLFLCIFLFGNYTGLSQNFNPPPQPAAQVYNEMQTLYLGNMQRRAHGLPPLRWNAQLANAARWFSWDSVENRAPGYCGHQDTLGRWSVERVAAFGYQGLYGVENVICGYTTPELAIQSWMANATHRENLLDGSSWEASTGYYLRDDGRGYVTYDLGQDPIYPPLVIENEALHSATPTVQLYIYDRESDDNSFVRMDSATEMRVSNDVYFEGIAWEPFANEKTWSLEPGSGWRTVYVQSRDAIGRVTTVSDTIYLGESAPQEELDLRLAASNRDTVTLYQLDGGGLPYVQLSYNWFVDDKHPQFECFPWGNCERVRDDDALGGTALRLFPGDGLSGAWVWTTSFIQDTPLTAYLRLKVSDNSSAAEVAQVSIQGGDATYGPLGLKGTDFDAANVYQSFPLDFDFHSAPPNDNFLIFNFQRSGQSDVYVDGVYIFSAPLPLQSPLVWTVPGGNYRGGGLWLRYSDGAGTFSAIQQADLVARRIAASPAFLFWQAPPGATLLPPRELAVLQMWDETFDWSASADADWLQAQTVGETLQVSADASSLGSGLYQATITIQTDALPNKPVLVPVLLLVSEQLRQVYLPLVSQLGP